MLLLRTLVVLQGQIILLSKDVMISYIWYRIQDAIHYLRVCILMRSEISVKLMDECDVKLWEGKTFVVRLR